MKIQSGCHMVKFSRPLPILMCTGAVFVCINTHDRGWLACSRVFPSVEEKGSGGPGQYLHRPASDDMITGSGDPLVLLKPSEGAGKAIPSPGLREIGYSEQKTQKHGFVFRQVQIRAALTLPDYKQRGPERSTYHVLGCWGTGRGQAG